MTRTNENDPPQLPGSDEHARASLDARRREAVARLRGLFAGPAPERALSAELLRERRAEAARE